jgi:hypothetical protein
MKKMVILIPENKNTGKMVNGVFVHTNPCKSWVRSKVITSLVESGAKITHRCASYIIVENTQIIFKGIHLDRPADYSRYDEDTTFLTLDNIMFINAADALNNLLIQKKDVKIFRFSSPKIFAEENPFRLEVNTYYKVTNESVLGSMYVKVKTYKAPGSPLEENCFWSKADAINYAMVLCQKRIEMSQHIIDVENENIKKLRDNFDEFMSRIVMEED